MQHPEEGIIHAWLDGALSPAESAALEAHVASCTECAARVAEARGLIAASSRIVGHLDVVPGGVLPKQAPPKRRRWLQAVPMLAAAGLLLTISLKLREPEEPIAPATELVTSPPAAQVADRPTVDTSTISRPPRLEPRRTRVATLPDSLTLPGANAAMQKSMVAPAQPTAAPLPAAPAPSAPLAAAPEARRDARAAAATTDSTREVEMARRRRALGSTNLSLSEVVVTGTSSAAPAAAAASGAALVTDTSAFVGCYERPSVPASNPGPFARVALVAEPGSAPGQLAVRTLDATGRIGPAIVGAGWTIQGTRAVVKDAEGRTLMTLVRTDSTIRVLTNEGLGARVVSCRK